MQYVADTLTCGFLRLTFKVLPHLLGCCSSGADWLFWVAETTRDRRYW